MKICSKCKEAKPLGDFSKDNRSKYGYKYLCKDCQKKYRENNKDKIKEYQKKYRENKGEKLLEQKRQYYQDNKDQIKENVKRYTEDNKEKIAEYKKQYAEDNKEKINEYMDQYYQDNGEKLKQSKKEYREDNKEKIKEQQKRYYEKNKDRLNQRNRQYYRDNKDKINNQKKERRKTDEKYRLRINMSTAFWEFCKSNKPDSTFSILPYTFDELYTYLHSTMKPEYEGKKLHVDHIIPQVLFDYRIGYHILKCWDLRNLRYLPKNENLVKSDNLDMELVREYGIEDLLP